MTVGFQFQKYTIAPVRASTSYPQSIRETVKQRKEEMDLSIRDP